MKPKEFKSWRKANGFNQTVAARKLGLKLRTVQYYEKGERKGKKIPIVYSANFSIGVTLLLKLVSNATKTLGFDWDIEVLEMHHKQKVDSPSGTALLLGRSAADARKQELSNVKSISRDGLVGKRKSDEIGFAVLRGGDVVGEHSVLFFNSGERIELAHKATDRSIFASGALRASYWAASAEPGFYSLAEVLENGG